MALIPPFFLDCVVAIGIQHQSLIPSMPAMPNSWIGTGFLVGRPLFTDTKPIQYNTYLVTNKHVIQNQQSIVVRFNSLQGNITQDYPVVLWENDKFNWIGHPSPNIDVAVIPIDPNFLKGNAAKFSFFELDNHSMNVNQMRATGISEGDFIYVLGFPMGNVTPNNNHVIARSGIIARIRDVIQNNYTEYLIDSSVYPGNSGGPVISKPEGIAITGTQSISNASLIGMVKSYLPYKDIAISQQTGNPRVIFEENSGLALVETIDSISHTVDLAYQHYHVS